MLSTQFSTFILTMQSLCASEASRLLGSFFDPSLFSALRPALRVVRHAGTTIMGIYPPGHPRLLDFIYTYFKNV